MVTGQIKLPIQVGRSSVSVFKVTGVPTALKRDDSVIGLFGLASMIRRAACCATSTHAMSRRRDYAGGPNPFK
jgi:hypothetical protein